MLMSDVTIRRWFGASSFRGRDRAAGKGMVFEDLSADELDDHHG
jgi:hypothetical protein